MPLSLQIPSPTIQHNYHEVTSQITIGGREVVLRLLDDIDVLPADSQITSASVIPFIQSGEIVAVTLKRGLDIPGGHVEPSDREIVDTLQREAYEEACLSLAEPLYLIGIIESNYDPTQATYMLIAASQVAHMDDFVVKFESIGREIVTPQEFMNRYTAGPKEMMGELIRRAEILISETSATLTS